MFRPGTKKYKNPQDSTSCGFFVVRSSPSKSPKSSHKSNIYGHIGFVTPVLVLLLGGCAVSKDKLTDSKLRTAKPEAKEYSLGDGDGLYLRVKPNGARLWVFNYYRPSDKKRANISFGPYPDVTLAAARERRREARALLAQAIDPKRHKEEQIAIVQAQQEACSNTFERMAAKWLELKRHDVSEAYAADSWRSLELYVLPFIGSMPIDQIRAPLVIELLRPIEADGKLETVRRLCQRINEILDYTVNHGLLDANPCAAIRKVFKKPTKKHMPTLKPDELPALMADIANGRLDHTTRCQIEWSLHTLVRPGESAGTRWDEIDFEAKVWNIPADRMKKDKPHLVSLSRQAVAMFEELKGLASGSEWVFPSRSDLRKPIAKTTLNIAVRALEIEVRDFVIHDFRWTASTHLHESGFNSDWIEKCLGRVIN